MKLLISSSRQARYPEFDIANGDHALDHTAAGFTDPPRDQAITDMARRCSARASGNQENPTIPLTLTLVLLAPRAHSQEDSTEPRAAWRHTAPARAVELNVGSGYNQGFGDISDSEGAIEDEAQNGTAVHFGLGYRLNPTG